MKPAINNRAASIAAQKRAYREANRGVRAQKNPPIVSTDKGEG